VQIVENKALLFKTRNPHKYSIIPKHKVMPVEGGYQVAVYWGLDEVRVLRNLGVKNVPSPITQRYDWPGRYKPMQHQIDTAAFLTMYRRAFVFSEPGTGKTLSALWAADYLMKLGKVRRVLILCPLSIMHSAWMGDINNSVIHRSAIIAHHPKAARRIEMIQQDYEIVISNYEGLGLIADEVKADGRFDLVIVDEANAYKTPTTRRWKALNSILNPNTYLWMMTGTPASQSPTDAYGLAKLVNPEGVPKFFTAWRDKVMNKLTLYKWVAKPTAKDDVFEALQPAIRFTKAECLDLPPSGHHDPRGGDDAPAGQVLQHAQDADAGAGGRGDHLGGQCRRCDEQALADFLRCSIHRRPRSGGVRFRAALVGTGGSAGGDGQEGHHLRPVPEHHRHHQQSPHQEGHRQRADSRRGVSVQASADHPQVPERAVAACAGDAAPSFCPRDYPNRCRHRGVLRPADERRAVHPMLRPCRPQGTEQRQGDRGAHPVEPG
jgi:hypothetical protein